MDSSPTRRGAVDSLEHALIGPQLTGSDGRGAEHDVHGTTGCEAPVSRETSIAQEFVLDRDTNRYQLNRANRADRAASVEDRPPGNDRALPVFIRNNRHLGGLQELEPGRGIVERHRMAIPRHEPRHDVIDLDVPVRSNPRRQRSGHVRHRALTAREASEGRDHITVAGNVSGGFKEILLTPREILLDVIQCVPDPLLTKLDRVVFGPVRTPFANRDRRSQRDEQEYGNAGVPDREPLPGLNPVHEPERRHLASNRCEWLADWWRVRVSDSPSGSLDSKLADLTRSIAPSKAHIHVIMPVIRAVPVFPGNEEVVSRRTRFVCCESSGRILPEEVIQHVGRLCAAVQTAGPQDGDLHAIGRMRQQGRGVTFRKGLLHLTNDLRFVLLREHRRSRRKGKQNDGENPRPTGHHDAATALNKLLHAPILSVRYGPAGWIRRGRFTRRAR